MSGAVFERRLIEKYISDNGVDPVANKPLSADDLIDVKGSVLCEGLTSGILSFRDFLE